MTTIYEKIEHLYNNNNLRVAFIRLGKGNKNQLKYINDKKLYIGYFSDEDETFKTINEHNLSDNSFNEFLKEKNKQKDLKNNLAPSALNLVYQDHKESIKKVLWFTIVDGTLYFGFTADDTKIQKIQEPESGCLRDMDTGWCNTDQNNEIIYERSVSGKITKKRIFQGTISEIDQKDIIYLVYRILNKNTEDKETAINAQITLHKSVENLIPQLNEYDFETLVEMLFLRQGYEKFAKSSGAEKAFDLALNRPYDRSENSLNPTFVQIKASINKQTVEKVYKDFNSDKSFYDYHDDGFLVYHSADKGFQVPKKFNKSGQNEINPSSKTLFIIGTREIAKQCIEFGKIDWLLSKVV